MITRTQKSPIQIEREDVRLSDREIIYRYLGIETFPCSISSPLREDDYRPSFSMQERGDVICWKDFGTGEHGNAVKLMSKLWRVSYSEALLKIKLDTENRIPRFSLIRKYNGKIHLNGSSSISVKTRDWKPWDEEFWNSFGITRKFAEWGNVHPISHAFFTREENGFTRTICVPMDKYAYAYFEWKDGNESVKLYQPFSTTLKWLSKHDSSVWDLWKQAFMFADRYSDEKLIITSSRKDALCLWNTLNIPAVSLQGEGYLPKPQVMKQVLNRFKTVYIWYDNDYTHTQDNPGQDNAKKLIELYPQLVNIYIPSELKAKDPSDLVKSRGGLGEGSEFLKKNWTSFIQKL